MFGVLAPPASFVQVERPGVIFVVSSLTLIDLADMDGADPMTGALQSPVALPLVIQLACLPVCVLSY